MQVVCVAYFVKDMRALAWQPTHQTRYRGLPRFLQVFFSALGLILLSPLFILVSLLVLSTGYPVFFKQSRVGLGGKEFTLFKFRSMRLSRSSLRITVADDQRITRVGKFLRKSKLDELPALFNVLKGDMSLVGPRPEVSEYVDLSDARWEKVLSVHPGITCPASIHARSEEDILKQVSDMDAEVFYKKYLVPYKLIENIHYIDRCDWKSDLSVLFQTLAVVCFPKKQLQESYQHIIDRVENDSVHR